MRGQRPSATGSIASQAGAARFRRGALFRQLRHGPAACACHRPPPPVTLPPVTVTYTEPDTTAVLLLVGLAAVGQVSLRRRRQGGAR